MDNFSLAEKEAGAFALRVNMPNSEQGRVEVIVNYPSDRAFQQWADCIHTGSLGARASRLARTAQETTVTTGFVSENLVGKRKEGRVARKRRETLEILEGVRPQYQMRDYGGPYQVNFEQMVRRVVPSKPKEVERLGYPAFHQMITIALAETDRPRVPSSLSEVLCPILLRLSPDKDEPNRLDRVCGARNLQGMDMSKFRDLMAKVARGGGKSHVLWICDPAEGHPHRIERDSWDLVPVAVSDNFF